MAVDTAAKRASATLFVIPSMAPGVFPDGTIDQGDRQASTWSYSGILAAGAPAPEPEPEPSPGTGGTTRQDHQYRPRLPRKRKDEEPTFRDKEPSRKVSLKPKLDLDLDRYGVPGKPLPTVITPKALSVDVEIGIPGIQGYLVVSPVSLEATPNILVPEIVVGPVTVRPQTISIGLNVDDQERVAIAEDDEEIMFILGFLRNR